MNYLSAEGGGNDIGCDVQASEVGIVDHLYLNGPWQGSDSWGRVFTPLSSGDLNTNGDRRNAREVAAVLVHFPEPVCQNVVVLLRCGEIHIRMYAVNISTKHNLLIAWYISLFLKEIVENRLGVLVPRE